MSETKSYCVYVTGSIIAKEGYHTCNGLSAGSITPDNVEFKSGHHPDKEFLSKRIVNGDLILDDTTTLMPFALYIAEGGIKGTKGSLSLKGAYSAWDTRQKGIMETFDKYKNENNPIIMNGIYISLFSSFELSFSDITIQAIIEKDKGDEVTRFINQSQSTTITSDDPWAFVETLQNKFIFHAFDKVAALYRTVLKVKIPSTRKLKQCLHKRNNIAHRAAYSSYDRITLTNASADDIQYLVDATTEFIDQLCAKVSE